MRWHFYNIIDRYCGGNIQLCEVQVATCILILLQSGLRLHIITKLSMRYHEHSRFSCQCRGPYLLTQNRLRKPGSGSGSDSR